MNKFELHTFGLPSFGLSDFRLTSFGGDGDGGRKVAFHNSLVDAWFMSGYSNSDKPKEIVGVRGNAIVLNNFLYSDKSGFNEVEGSLIFDGVDDYGIWEEKPLLTDYTAIYKRLIVGEGRVASCADSTTWGGAFGLETVGSYTVQSFGGITNDLPIEKEVSVSYMTPTSYNGEPINKGTKKDNNFLILGASFKDIDKGTVGAFFNGSIYYFALYNKSLSHQEIEEEKIKLEQKWKSKLK